MSYRKFIGKLGINQYLHPKWPKLASHEIQRIQETSILYIIYRPQHKHLFGSMSRVRESVYSPVRPSATSTMHRREIQTATNDE